MALGILMAENDDMLHTQATTDVSKQKGFGSLKPYIFVLLLLSIQGSTAVSTIKCKSYDMKYMYEQVQKTLWNTSIRPVSKTNETLNIVLGFTIGAVLGVDVQAQLLRTFIFRTLDWNVTFLSWNETECGTNKISYPKSELWIPDIHISEFMDEDKSPTEPYVYIYSNGRIHLDEPKRVVSSCNLNIYRFPFDVQNCSLTFASYLHEENEINLTSKLESYIMKTSTTYEYTDGEWKLMDIKANISAFNVSLRRYSAVIYYIIVKRVATLYVVNLLIPSGFLITLDLFSFLLPPQTVDRSAFKMTLILGYTVFLLIINDLLPHTSQETPLINVYFSICLALMVVSLLETIFIVNLINSTVPYPKVPHWVHILVLRFLARLVFISSNPSPPNTLILERASSSAGVTAQPEITADLEKPEAAFVEELRKLGRNVKAIRLNLEEPRTLDPTTEDWYQISKVIDRFLFIIYIIFVFVSFTTIIILWANH
ncbi:5-hydroxytryptamine receptor 3C-like [Brachyhypopomus gauderio]|uniref:5-hydroxytryptamine receptor 3C-like n=1 Tax=Brachyhypopomus gauderio TaxID=698409 RepID=UPI0040419F73